MSQTGETRKLTLQQALFAREYVFNGGNGRAAVIAAGYSESSSNNNYCAQLLDNPRIQEEIGYWEDVRYFSELATRERLIYEAFENVKAARENQQIGAANGALRLIAEMTGALTNNEATTNEDLPTLFKTLVHATSGGAQP